MNVEIILNKKDGTIDLLYNSYNIIKSTLYNEELTSKIIELIENELKNNGINESLEEYLQHK